MNLIEFLQEYPIIRTIIFDLVTARDLIHLLMSNRELKWLMSQYQNHKILDFSHEPIQDHVLSYFNSIRSLDITACKHLTTQCLKYIPDCIELRAKYTDFMYEDFQLAPKLAEVHLSKDYLEIMEFNPDHPSLKKYHMKLYIGHKYSSKLSSYSALRLVTKLNIDQLGQTEISDNFFSQFIHLTKLILKRDQSGLKNLHQATQLRTLILSKLDLTIKPNSLFEVSKCTQLSYLKITQPRGLLKENVVWLNNLVRTRIKLKETSTNAFMELFELLPNITYLTHTVISWFQPNFIVDPVSLQDYSNVVMLNDTSIVRLEIRDPDQLVYFNYQSCIYKHVRQICYLWEIKELKVHFQDAIQSWRELEVIQPYLSRLNISSMNLDNQLNLENLQYLKMGQIRLPDDFFHGSKPMKKLICLEMVEMAFGGYDINIIIDYLKELNQLQLLNLRSNDLSDQIMTIVPNLKDLRKLALDMNEITGIHLDLLKGSRLINLSLQNNPLKAKYLIPFESSTTIPYFFH